MVALCLFCVDPAQAGQLFPPMGLPGGDAHRNCDNGQMLSWNGVNGTVECRDPTPGVTVSCPSGQALTGVSQGSPVCSPLQASECPSGFKQLGNLGCLEVDQEPAASCINAVESCYDKYQGRLPSYSERLIGHARTGIVTSEYEWIDVGTYGGDQGGPNARSICSVFRGSADVNLGIQNGAPGALPYFYTTGYRCFIPR